MATAISNPPYNLKWEPTVLANLENRFVYGVPPKSNANYAFVLSALEKNERCVFILPRNVLDPNTKEEKAIIKRLVENNLVDAAILLPDNMFEATSISTCILVLDKDKKTSNVMLYDLREFYESYKREQKGQFGSKAHTNRVYEKEYKKINDETIAKVIETLDSRKEVDKFCKPVTIEEIRSNNYKLTYPRYCEINIEDFHNNNTRSYADILDDLNRVILEKNKCKLTINETIAKNMGFDINLYKKDKQCLDSEFDKLLEKLTGKKINKSDYFQTTKNKNQIKFENNSKDDVSHLLVMLFSNWKQHIYYLNQEENRYLTELRDKLLPDLMSGKVQFDEDSWGDEDGN